MEFHVELVCKTFAKNCIVGQYKSMMSNVTYSVLAFS
jgi:hypothetical protein